MSLTAKTHSSPVELDRAFHYAVTLAWEDLMKPIEPRAIRVEYLSEPGSPLDHLSVWSVRAGGYQDLVCDFQSSASVAHPSGACFGNRYSSDKLAASLGFIMKNQGQFTRPADACRRGLIVIHAPDADDRREAATWMNKVRGLGLKAIPEEAAERSRAQEQLKKKALSTRHEEAHLHNRNTIVADQTVEAPAKTNAERYFELRYAWPE